MIESDRLKNINWEYVIIDEGHRLKVFILFLKNIFTI